MPDCRRLLRFPYVLFDLGGTLIYFDGEWDLVLRSAADETARALVSLGYPVNENEFPSAYSSLMKDYFQRRVDEEVEYPASLILSEALRSSGFSTPPDSHLRQVLRAQYAVSQAHWRCEPDASVALEALLAYGCRLGIVSNAADDEDVQTLVDQAGLRKYFDFVLTSAEAGYRKPGHHIFDQALRFWNAAPAQAVMIGDTVPADVAGANRCGIASVWIPRRANTSENWAAAEMSRPGAVIETLSELPALLRGWPLSDG